MNWFMLNCKLPASHRDQIPDSVSIVEQECDEASNILKVIYKIPRREETKKTFAVCSKGLSIQDDQSLETIEWLEVLKSLGADKVILYTYQDVHPKVLQVLDYYQRKGFVEVTPLYFPGFQPNTEGIQHDYLYHDIANRDNFERLIYNDCFYRNIYMFDFITLLGTDSLFTLILKFTLDNDEVIVPVNHTGWQDMFQQLFKDHSSKGAWLFNNYYFLTSYSNSTELGYPILNSKHRMSMKQGIQKYFANTSEASVLTHHTPTVGSLNIAIICIS